MGFAKMASRQFLFVCFIACTVVQMMAAPIATPDEKIEADKPETQADAAKDGSAPLACSFMKCPKDRPYCQMGSCVAKKDAKGGAATGGYDFSKFTKSYAGGKDSKRVTRLALITQSSLR